MLACLPAYLPAYLSTLGRERDTYNQREREMPRVGHIVAQGRLPQMHALDSALAKPRPRKADNPDDEITLSSLYGTSGQPLE